MNSTKTTAEITQTNFEKRIESVNRSGLLTCICFFCLFAPFNNKSIELIGNGSNKRAGHINTTDSTFIELKQPDVTYREINNNKNDWLSAEYHHDR